MSRLTRPSTLALAAGLLVRCSCAGPPQVQGHRPAAGHRHDPEEQGAAVLRELRARDRAADRHRLQAASTHRHQGLRAAAGDEGRACSTSSSLRARRRSRATSRPSSAWTWSASTPTTRPRRKVVEAYKDAVDAAAAAAVQHQAARRLAVRPADHLLQAAITGLADLKGKKVRDPRRRDGQVHGEGRRDAGDDGVRRGVAGPEAGLVDCAVTGPSSANSAGWPESATHVYSAGAAGRRAGLRHQLNAWNKLHARPAGQAAGRDREAHRRHLEVFGGAVGRRHALQRRPGSLHDRQEVHADRRCRFTPGTSSW